jgi:hypothetical protein
MEEEVEIELGTTERNDRLLEFHRSFTSELEALKNRIRNLVDHWPSDGEYKECALRTVLKRHMPSSVRVGRGFVVDESTSSTQADIIIVDGSKPTLFSDGDFMIVTPDCVKSVIEVKTSIKGSQAFEDAIIKLARIGSLCPKSEDRRPWLGFFCYEGSTCLNEVVFKALQDAYNETGATIDGLTIGPDRFFRFKPESKKLEKGEVLGPTSFESQWRAYELDRLSTSYFIGNVINHISSVDQDGISTTWFPLPEGKYSHSTGGELRRKREGTTSTLNH